MASPIYAFSVKTIDQQDKKISDYQGKVLLIVNTASKCGFTPQYEGLQALYEQYNGQGFEVLAFPCNQFGKQEPDDHDGIVQFCQTSYQITFPLFAKIDVNGKNASPLFRYLKSQQAGFLGTGAIKWNFTKFLVGKKGDVVKRYPPMTPPDKIAADVGGLVKFVPAVSGRE